MSRQQHRLAATLSEWPLLEGAADMLTEPWQHKVNGWLRAGVRVAKIESKFRRLLRHHPDGFRARVLRAVLAHCERVAPELPADAKIREAFLLPPDQADLPLDVPRLRVGLPVAQPEVRS